MARLANNPTVVRDLAGRTRSGTRATPETSSSSIELDFVRKRFLQQNKVLATKNSELMSKITQLEDQLTSTQSENLALRNAEAKIKDQIGKSLTSLEIDLIGKFQQMMAQINQMRQELALDATMAENQLAELKNAKLQEIRNREQINSERWKRRRRSLSIRAETVEPETPVVVYTPEPEKSAVVEDLSTPMVAPVSRPQKAPSPEPEPKESPEVLATPPRSKGSGSKAIEIQSVSPEILATKPKRPAVFQDNVDPLSMPMPVGKQRRRSSIYMSRKKQRKSLVEESPEIKAQRASISSSKRANPLQELQQSQINQLRRQTISSFSKQTRDDTPADSVFEFMETTVNSDQENLNRQRRRSMSFRRTPNGIEEIH
ncbi:hypothetical protein OGAPHI_005210 [Ogataea philodendri]|uniref:Shugoshin N-terminal coiled-coil domain-containing protein n=1 Tax=Ogataea philodendri TaxID=1378263 RepID=A0A9P8P2U5_9ASCO|nr:uncharacterized protein OGAPHI_005210 [Ogataea philodendri]KAH3663807.1 hypothetical protein OGAPHI_005210 [Ogataea philodendri]